MVNTDRNWENVYGNSIGWGRGKKYKTTYERVYYMEILSHDSELKILAIVLLVSILKTMVITMIKKIS